MKYAPYLCPDCYARLIDTATEADSGAGAVITAPLLECEDGCGVSDRALKPYRTRMNGRRRPATRVGARRPS